MKKDPWRGVSRVFFVREGFPASTHRLKEAGVLSIVINNCSDMSGRPACVYITGAFVPFRTTGNSLSREKRLPGYSGKPHGLSCLADLNCRPPPYQGDALPAEPRQRTHLLCFSNLQYSIMDQQVCQRKKQKNLNKFFIQKDQFLGKLMEVQTCAGNIFRSAFIFCSKKDIEVLICQRIQHQCRNRRERIRRRL